MNPFFFIIANRNAARPKPAAPPSPPSPAPVGQDKKPRSRAKSEKA